MEREWTSSERSLRVFEMFRVSSGRELPPLEVDLPVALARRHRKIHVVFRHADEFGWHAHVTDAEGIVLLSFPWTDHVDQILTSADSGELPVKVGEEGWDDLEEGWWGRVLVDGPDVFIAETDLGAIDDVEKPHQVEQQAPGIVLVGGVAVRWNVVTKQSWDEAWRVAVEACRQGRPTPVGYWAGESSEQLVIRDLP